MNILWNLLGFGKCLSRSFRKVFPTCVSTFTLNGGLKLIDKHFGKTNKFHKVFNRNKVSYSCLPNFANIIKSHNNRTLSEEKTQDQPKCNCRQKDTCLLEGHSLDSKPIFSQYNIFYNHKYSFFPFWLISFNHCS